MCSFHGVITCVYMIYSESAYGSNWLLSIKKQVSLSKSLIWEGTQSVITDMLDFGLIILHVFLECIFLLSLQVQVAPL